MPNPELLMVLLEMGQPWDITFETGDVRDPDRHPYNHIKVDVNSGKAIMDFFSGGERYGYHKSRMEVRRRGTGKPFLNFLGSERTKYSVEYFDYPEGGGEGVRRNPDWYWVRIRRGGKISILQSVEGERRN